MVTSGVKLGLTVTCNTSGSQNQVTRCSGAHSVPFVCCSSPTRCWGCLIPPWTPCLHPPRSPSTSSPCTEVPAFWEATCQVSLPPLVLVAVTCENIETMTITGRDFFFCTDSSSWSVVRMSEQSNAVNKPLLWSFGLNERQNLKYIQKLTRNLSQVYLCLNHRCEPSRFPVT